jgi:hypothetical protein
MIPKLPMPATPSSPGSPAASAPIRTEPELAPEDFYMDGPYLVFTAAYHLKRGACCHSGCRHCPYGEDE